MTGLSIGKLSKAADVKIPTIRFYEQIGLMPEPDRSESDRRVYGADAVRRLRFIRHARQLGFEVRDIEALLRLADQPKHPCADAEAIAKTHLKTVNAKIAQLTALRDELARMVICQGTGEVETCHVIEVLSDHAQCQADHS